MLFWNVRVFDGPERPRDERERGGREALRELGRGGTGAQRREDLVDLVLVDRSHLSQPRAQRRVALELLAEGIELEGFDQIVDDAALQGGAERLDVIRRCDRDDVHGRPARRVELPEDLEPGTVGEVDVEQHQIGTLILRPGERITRGVGDADDRE